MTPPRHHHPHSASLTAGIPATNAILYHAIRFLVGDPAALIEIPGAHPSRLLILREIEMARARQHARADAVFGYSDFAPEGGLSGDRATASAQAVVECLRRHGITRVITDRSLPFIYAYHLQAADIAIDYDPDKGVLDRRTKDEQEIAHLAEAQRITEQVMERTCQLIACAPADAAGLLQHEGETLTAERVQRLLDIWLLELGYANPGSIVACGREGGDCHNHGHGPLRTGQPVIVDIFPQNKTTLYNGDCTRVVVHGDIPDEIARYHAAVLDAKAAAIAATKAGTTGEAVHNETIRVITAHGYHMGLPADDAPDDFASMPHGTGHGIGIEVHEPPLLDVGGPELLVGDVLTIEPGLYAKALGGVRIEDMVVVTETGCTNLNTLHEGLDWR
ncbi:Aminopeptidase YpdF (MP-, MA-, MS-, AP-, NP-specific) [hydrothermal vent metagenome]|uniref:Aminopeptidase YpdF (MP-, MA-, MS-, AP-, NP-specific) n=1 Tax=hydrothermal vent metagenome TaxID=652676 RepID=A0A3B1DC88_9ZZZZ